ncbi:MAG: hypothetical protein JKY95_07755 [Planctomycetaceae bacterium]|nr:hypothetical protein [Planctomycetaceae bacterium]
MSDLTDLSSVSGTELTAEQIRGILYQIDLDVTNLLRDGKLSALKYAVGGNAGANADRGSNLLALLQARTTYERLLREQEQRESPDWVISQADTNE